MKIGQSYDVGHDEDLSLENSLIPGLCYLKMNVVIDKDDIRLEVKDKK